MEGQRDESGRYLPEVRRAVIEEVRRSGVWAAVERFGVAFGTVTYWWAQERKRERALGEAVGRETSVPAVAPAPTPGEAELTLWRVHTRLEAGEGLAGEVHDPGLEARLLTLFQVVSRHGKPEVWLLGNRIL